MNLINAAETLLPRIVPFLSGCDDNIAKITLQDAVRTFARESDIILETQSYVLDKAPAYGNIPELSEDPDNFMPLHFVSYHKDGKNKVAYITYSLLPKSGMIPEEIVNRHYEAICAYALFILYNMPGKPWTSADMAAFQLQKYRIALGDAIRDNTTKGAVFDQIFICADPGDAVQMAAVNTDVVVSDIDQQITDAILKGEW